MDIAPDHLTLPCPPAGRLTSSPSGCSTPRSSRDFHVEQVSEDTGRRHFAKPPPYLPPMLFTHPAAVAATRGQYNVALLSDD